MATKIIRGGLKRGHHPRHALDARRAAAPLRRSGRPPISDQLNEQLNEVVKEQLRETEERAIQAAVRPANEHGLLAEDSPEFLARMDAPEVVRSGRLALAVMAVDGTWPPEERVRRLNETLRSAAALVEDGRREVLASVPAAVKAARRAKQREMQSAGRLTYAATIKGRNEQIRKVARWMVRKYGLRRSSVIKLLAEDPSKMVADAAKDDETLSGFVFPKKLGKKQLGNILTKRFFQDLRTELDLKKV